MRLLSKFLLDSFETLLCQQTCHYSSRAPAQLNRLSNTAVKARRLALFDQEKEKQKRRITNVEKIKVKYCDQPEETTIMMNKKISTPFDCARHMSKLVGERAVLADVDGKIWDMHRPLEGDVETLKYLHFKEADPFYVNKAFWRSCSLMLGAVLESAFKDSFYVQLCSFPAPNVRTGSFVYDVDLGIDWQPTKDELRVMSSEMVRLSMKMLPFERLSVPVDVALDMFSDNIYKSSQIPSIAQAENNETVTLYRVGDFVDASCGPLIANTGQLGRVSIMACHPIPTPGGKHSSSLIRVQGVALPQGILMNHYSYGILEKRAAKMNEGRLPDMPETQK